jgi:hypothetical protein
MKKVRKFILPHLVWQILSKSIEELNYFRKYLKILSDLKEDGSLDKLGIRLEQNGEMFIGVNLNPELLIYELDAQEPVEMRFLTEAMKKYTDFFTRMSVIDYIMADYERVKTEDYYGYVVKLYFNFKFYSKFNIIYSAAYFVTTTALAIAGILAVL